MDLPRKSAHRIKIGLFRPSCTSLKEMTNVGAEIVQDIKDVANGLLIAQVKDINGNVVGLRQQS